MSAIIRTKETSRIIQLGPVTVRSILNAADTGGAFDLLELSAGLDGIGPPPHIHPHTHETFTVLEGSVEFTVGREKVVASAGATVHVPPGTPHAFRYVGPTRNRMLATLTPSVNMEQYFADLQALIRESMPPDRTKAFALMARHDTVPA